MSDKKEKIMKLIPIFLLLFMAVCTSQSIVTTPSQKPIDMYEIYNINETLNAVCRLQELGERKAIAELKSWAKGDSADLLTIVICRMLFTGKESPLRRPYLGDAAFFGITTYKDWPIEPITIYEGVPILITRGYTLGGLSESAEDYLSYCIEEGSWVSKKYEDKTLEQIKVSLEKFISETKWKKDLSETDRKFFMSQIKQE